MGLPDSRRVPRVPRYLGTLFSKSNRFRLQGYHLLWQAFPGPSAIDWIYDLPRGLQPPPIRPRNTEHTTLAGLSIYSVWAAPISLAATLGIAVAFFSWGYWDVSVLLVSLCHLCIQRQMSWNYPGRVFPFRDLRVKACLTARRSLSQLATSFIAIRRQGIHRLPLVAWP